MTGLLPTSRRTPEENDFFLPYQTDVQKILYSKAYARYADKTQVVYLFPHDHISSRGLHVQLVSFFARFVGEKLQADLDLIEAISLGHDMGHAPFGHEGEMYLSELSRENGCGVFSHARQSCRIAKEIENLNLTFAVLDGFLTHDGGMKEADIAINPDKNWKTHEEELAMRLVDPEVDLKPCSLEAALVKICDTACYLQRDLQDALTLGIVASDEVPDTLFGRNAGKITRIVGEDIVESYAKKKRLCLSRRVFENLQQIRTFNFAHIYVHESLKTESRKIHTVYRLLFSILLDEWKQKARDSLLWKHYLHNKLVEYIESNRPEQLVIDYIAGMTDGYFLRLFQSLYVPKTINVPDVLPFS